MSVPHLCAESLSGSVCDVGVHVLGVDGFRGHKLTQQSDHLPCVHANREEKILS